jgi:hypothetical protein
LPPEIEQLAREYQVFIRARMIKAVFETELLKQALGLAGIFNWSGFKEDRRDSSI